MENGVPVCCEDAEQGGCTEDIRVVCCWSIDDDRYIGYLGLCAEHRRQRGYAHAPRLLSDHEARAHLDAHPRCSDVERFDNPYGSNPRREPECILTDRPLNWRAAEKAELAVLHFPQEDVHVVICHRHAAQRGYPKPALIYSDGHIGAEASYVKRRRFNEADRAFVQTYHPELVCVVNTPDCVRHEVARYYFSDGSTRRLCTFHLARNEDVLRGGSRHGHAMSVEFYKQVYAPDSHGSGDGSKDD